MKTLLLAVPNPEPQAPPGLAELVDRSSPGRCARGAGRWRRVSPPGRAPAGQVAVAALGERGRSGAGRVIPTIICKVVDLPAPSGPRKPVRVPGWHANVTRRRRRGPRSVG
jgi:hypothetical protein